MRFKYVPKNNVSTDIMNFKPCCQRVEMDNLIAVLKNKDKIT